MEKDKKDCVWVEDKMTFNIFGYKVSFLGKSDIFHVNR